VYQEAKIGEKLSAWLAKKKACNLCCCSSHCSIVVHDPTSCEIQMTEQQVHYQGMLDRSWLDELEYREDVHVKTVHKDLFLDMICAVNMDLPGAADVTTEVLVDPSGPGFDTK
jgi:hypothetical protein